MSDDRSPEEKANEKFQDAKIQKDVDVIRAYKVVYGTPDGKKVLYDAMKSCYFLGSSYSPDPIAMAYNEGRRSTVLDILKILGKNESEILNFYKQSKENDEGYFT